MIRLNVGNIDRLVRVAIGLAQIGLRPSGPLYSAPGSATTSRR